MVLECGRKFLVFLDVARLIVEGRNVRATSRLANLMMIVSVDVSGRLLTNLQLVLMSISGLVLDLVEVDVRTVQEGVRLTISASRRLLITEAFLLGRGLYLMRHLALESRLLVTVLHILGVLDTS